MKKLFFAFFIITCFATSLNAQKMSSHGGTMFSLSANVGPANTSGYTIAFGGNLQAAFPVASDFAITASAGYENFSYKVYGIKGHISYIPLLGGVKVFLSPKFYAQGELGYSVSTTSGGGGAFSYSPKVAYVISSNIDLGVQYFAMSKSGATLSAILASIRVNF